MDWLTFIGFAIAGILVIINLFDRNAKSQREEFQKQEENLRLLYKEEIGQLTKKLDEQEKTTKELEKKVEKITIENELMRTIITGQDTETKTYKDRAMKAMEATDKVLSLTVENGNKLVKTLESIERLYNVIEKHIVLEAKVLKSAK